MKSVIIYVKKGADLDLARSLSKKIDSPIEEKLGAELSVVFDSKGVSLCGHGLTYQGNFEEHLRRVSDGRLAHEMLVRAAKTSETGLTAIDATAGMGEDSFLLAAYGYNVILHEQNLVVAALLKDAIRRGKKNPALRDIMNRMTVVEGDSVQILNNRIDTADLVYLDPMFPGKAKSSLTNKKMQLIQEMETPCSEETELFDAALSISPAKIIVKRPLKAPYLAGRKPGYSLEGKAIRYDCYVQ